MFLPPASGGAQGPQGKGCTKATPPNMPERACRAANPLPSLGLDCAEQQSCLHSVHPPALSSRLPTLRHPRAGHAAPGHTAQHATDKHWDGLQLSLAAANPTKHSHRQRAIMMGLGSGLPLAVGGDPAPCAVLCRHSWPVPLVLRTREGSPALWFHRDVALSPHILQAGGSREHQGYPKVGYAMSPGLLCGAQAASAL